MDERQFGHYSPAELRKIAAALGEQTKQDISEKQLDTLILIARSLHRIEERLERMSADPMDEYYAKAADG